MLFTREAYMAAADTISCRYDWSCGPDVAAARAAGNSLLDGTYTDQYRTVTLANKTALYPEENPRLARAGSLLRAALLGRHRLHIDACSTHTTG
jgi:hypothetical protein